MATRIDFLRRMALPALVAAALQAGSPAYHESQTRLALSRIPKAMAQALRSQNLALMSAARGTPGSKIPTPEDVEAQFQRVVRLCHEGKTPDVIARELGVLANQVQLLTDPSCLYGITPLRLHFERYGDEMLPHLVLTDEPYWSLTGTPDPRPKLLEYAKIRAERYSLLETTFDEISGKRLVVWDRLSIPFAMLQLGYSSGVHATANVWIMVYRVTGESWAPLER